MKLRFTKLTQLSLRCQDADLGWIQDVAVSTADGSVVELIASTRRWLPGETLYVPSKLVQGFESLGEHLPVAATKAQIMELVDNESRRSVPSSTTDFRSDSTFRPPITPPLASSDPFPVAPLTQSPLNWSGAAADHSTTGGSIAQSTGLQDNEIDDEGSGVCTGLELLDTDLLTADHARLPVTDLVIDWDSNQVVQIAVKTHLGTDHLVDIDQCRMIMQYEELELLTNLVSQKIEALPTYDSTVPDGQSGEFESGRERYVNNPSAIGYRPGDRLMPDESSL